jgi:hypothetical protein
MNRRLADATGEYNRVTVVCIDPLDNTKVVFPGVHGESDVVRAGTALLGLGVRVHILRGALAVVWPLLRAPWLSDRLKALGLGDEVHDAQVVKDPVQMTAVSGGAAEEFARTTIAGDTISIHECSHKVAPIIRIINC